MNIKSNEIVKKYISSYSIYSSYYLTNLVHRLGFNHTFMPESQNQLG